jgi:hypothetical protein
MLTVELFSREWLDDNEYDLTDKLFQKFDLLNESDWEKADDVAIASIDDEPVGVIIGYGNNCLICQVAWDKQKQGIGTSLVNKSGMIFPKQNGCPEFWEKFEN